MKINQQLPKYIYYKNNGLMVNIKCYCVEHPNIKNKARPKDFLNLL